MALIVGSDVCEEGGRKNRKETESGSEREREQGRERKLERESREAKSTFRGVSGMLVQINEGF